MQRLLPALMAGLVVACACVSATAGDVYQWKDAKGITHYSNTPPANGTYKTRVVHSDDTPAVAPAATSATASAAPSPTPSAAPATSPAAEANPGEDPGCAIARKDVELLQAKAPVLMDSDGDGKPDKILSDEDRAKHLQIAQSALEGRCAQAPAGN
jgi:hypothetical protein